MKLLLLVTTFFDLQKSFTFIRMATAPINASTCNKIHHMCQEKKTSILLCAGFQATMLVSTACTGTAKIDAKTKLGFQA